VTASRGPSVGHQMWRSRLVLGAALALSMLASSCSADWSATIAHADTETTATVLRVVDGDTIDVIDDRRGRLRIRVLGRTRSQGCRPRAVGPALLRAHLRGTSEINPTA
jgi:endonuclease YncB( thermonuclease family)